MSLKADECNVCGGLILSRSTHERYHVERNEPKPSWDFYGMDIQAEHGGDF